MYLNSLKNEKGAVAVEFALVMPLLIFLVLLLVDFGRLSYVQMSLNAAVQEGARASSFGLTDTSVIQTVKAASPGVAQISQMNSTPDVSVSFNSRCSTTIVGENTSITASITFDWITPIELFKYLLPSSTFGNNTSLNATGVIICII